MSSTMEFTSRVITMEFSASHLANEGSFEFGVVFSNNIANFPLSSNIHSDTLRPTKKIVPVKPNGGYLDSWTIGMDTVVKDFVHG